MAEFAASIIAIVSAGTKVTLVLSKVGSELGSAGKEARMIASEIRSFCVVLKTLQKAVGQVERSPYYAQCRDVVADMTLASTEMFADVLDAAESVQKMTSGSTKNTPGKDESMSVRQRVNWVLFKKPKITMLRASLESYKSTMVLLLGTINISERSARRLSMVPTEQALKEEDEDKVELESLQLAQQDSLMELEAVKKRLSSSLNDGYIEPKRIESFEAWMPNFPSEDSPNEELREEIRSLRNSVVGSDSKTGILEIADRSETHNRRTTIALYSEHNRLSRVTSTVVLGTTEIPSKPDPFSTQDLCEYLEARRDDATHGDLVRGTMAALEDKEFEDELDAIEQWFRVLSEEERSAAFIALSIQMNRRFIPFLTEYLQRVRDEHGAKVTQEREVTRSIALSVRRPSSPFDGRESIALSVRRARIQRALHSIP